MHINNQVHVKIFLRKMESEGGRRDKKDDRSEKNGETGGRGWFGSRKRTI